MHTAAYGDIYNNLCDFRTLFHEVSLIATVSIWCLFNKIMIQTMVMLIK